MKELELAVIENFRWWLTFDGIEKVRIRSAGGRLDCRSVRRIARAYGVLRGIPAAAKDDNNDRAATEIAYALNSAAQHWPEALTERAGLCAKVAKTLVDEKVTKRRPISATTKLMWFLRPDDWTVFDDLAATGLGISDQDRSVRMERFYGELDQRGFIEAARVINGMLAHSAFKDIRGERVIDQLLLCRGRRKKRVQECQEIYDNCSAFLEMLPTGISKELRSVAAEIAAQVGDNILVRRSAPQFG